MLIVTLRKRKYLSYAVILVTCSGLRFGCLRATNNIMNFCKLTMFVGTKKEKFYYHNSLLCLVRAMEGKDLTVDLRNDDSYVCGHVDSVDGFMNISFSNAVYCDPQGNEYHFNNLFLHARNIRYVHVPENICMSTTIKNELSGNKKPHSDTKDVRNSRKVKKALKLHMETVASLGNQ